MARLVLVGLPGVGKSTAALALASFWHCDAIDTDDVLGEQVGESAATYLREQGEATFREKERDALRDALKSDAVVATGAGVVTTDASRDLLRGAPVLWLDCDDEILLGRVSEGDRPLLGADHRESLVRLRREREVWYRDVSRARVDASGSTEDVLRRVLDEIANVAS